MNCANCGAGVDPGVRECPSCGNQICDNNYVYGKISLTWEEARKGGTYAVELQNLVNPIRVRVKPRTRSGDKVRVAGAMFMMADESIMLAPVEVTVHVERRPLWQPMLAVLACLLLTTAACLGVMGLVEAGKNAPVSTNQSSISANTGTLTTTQPTQTTAPTTPDPTTTAEPSTQPNESAATDPSTQPDESAATDPSTQPDESTATEPSTAPAQISIIPHMDTRPMLQQLPEEHLEVAEVIYQACMDFKPSTEIPPCLTVEEFWNLCTILHYECPELMQFEIYAVSTNCYYDANGIVTSYDLPYGLTESEYTQMYSDCVEVVDRIVDETQGMTVWEKERYIYDYITSNCHYDLDMAKAGTAYGTLVQEIAKCDGISFAVKWIMEEMGITCVVAGGDPKQGEIGHVWNYVLLEGTYYCLDVTPDVPTADSTCPPLYGVYNVTSDFAGKDFILYPAFQNYSKPPVATTMDRSFHVENGSYVWKGQDWKPGLKTAFQAALETKEDVFLQFEDAAEYQACLKVLESVLNDFWKDAGMPGNVNWLWWFNDGYYVIRIVVD